MPCRSDKIGLNPTQANPTQPDPWVNSTRVHMGVNATVTLGPGGRSSQAERESRRRRRRWGWGLGRGYAPSQKINEFFISKWCDMVHSGCVVFKIHVSHGLQLYDKTL